MGRGIDCISRREHKVNQYVIFKVVFEIVNKDSILIQINYIILKEEFCIAHILHHILDK